MTKAFRGVGLGAALVLGMVGGLCSTGAAQAASCGDRASQCLAACTPAKVSRYYFGVAARCTASCEPRWNQCLRTGTWVHIEDRYPGNVERVDLF